MLGIAEYFWRLIPANPILLRVVQMNGKRRRDLFIRCGYLALLIGVFVFALGLGNTSTGNLAELSKTSVWLFQVLSYVQLGLVALLAPIFTASAITQERDSQTYDILLTTPLSNGQIVLGSLLSRLFFVVALLISGIPIFSMTQIFGGVAISAIVQSFLIAASTALVTGAVAMAIAVLKVGTRRTIFSFYLFIVVYLVGLFVLDRVQYFQVLADTSTTTSTSFTPDPALHYENLTKESEWADADTTKVKTYTSTIYIPKPDVNQLEKVDTIREVKCAKSSWFTGLHPFLALRTIFHGSDYKAPLESDLPPNLRGGLLATYITDPAGFYIGFMFIVSFLLISPSVLLLRRLAQSTTSMGTVVLRKLRLVRGDRTRTPRTVWSNPIAWREAKTKASAARATFLRYGFMTAGIGGALLILILFTTHAALPGTQYVDANSYNPAYRQMVVYNQDGIAPKTLPLSQDPPAVITFTDSQQTDPKVDHVPVSPEVLMASAASGRLAITSVDTVKQGGTDVAWFRIDAAVVPRRLSAADARRALFGAAAIELAVILLIVTNAAASTVTREKEDGTLDLLLSTPITSRYYIWGKLRGLVSFMLPMVAVPVASVALFIVYDSFRRFTNWNDANFQWIVFPEAVLLLPAMLVIVVAFASILGMNMSLRARKTVVAVMSSIGIVVGICAAMGWCGYTMLQSGKADTAQYFGLAVSSFSPFGLLTIMIDPYSFAADSFSGDKADFSRIEVFIVAWIAIGAYGAIVYTMYKSMVKNFDMTIRKQSR